MVAVASSSYTHGFGSAWSNGASWSAEMTNLCSQRTVESASSSSGSTISTRAPLCSTMYFTSSATSRKLIGTSTRPEPLTPNRAVSNRAEF